MGTNSSHLNPLQAQEALESFLWGDMFAKHKKIVYTRSILPKLSGQKLFHFFRPLQLSLILFKCHFMKMYDLYVNILFKFHQNLSLLSLECLQPECLCCLTSSINASKIYFERKCFAFIFGGGLYMCFDTICSI